MCLVTHSNTSYIWLLSTPFFLVHRTTHNERKCEMNYVTHMNESRHTYLLLDASKSTLFFVTHCCAVYHNCDEEQCTLVTKNSVLSQLWRRIVYSHNCCGIPHNNVWLDAFICAAFICESWRIHMGVLTDSYVSHDSSYVRHMCGIHMWGHMNESCLIWRIWMNASSQWVMPGMTPE